MPELSDHLRAWADEPRPVTAAEARRAAAGGGRSHRSRPRLLLAAAAAVVVVAATVVLAGRGDGGDPKVRVTPAAPSTTAPSSTGSTTSTTFRVNPPPIERRPATFVAHDDRHRLVVVDAGTGTVTRVLASFDDPADFGGGQKEPVATGNFLDGVVVSPDGRTVYYGTCCEPAPGEVFSVPISGGTPTSVGYGADPAVSPDGTRLAVVLVEDLVVLDLRGGPSTTYRLGAGVVAANPSWSPDGSTIAVERRTEAIGEIVLVDLVRDRDATAAGRVVATTDAHGVPTLPLFDHRGGLHIVRTPDAASREEERWVSRIETLVPETGVVVRAQDLDHRIQDQRIDATGSWLLQIASDGTVTSMTLEDGGREVRPGRWNDAAW